MGSLMKPNINYTIFQNWKKRWFVLRTTRLSYYKTDKEYELLCVINLADIHTIAEVEHKKRDHVFGLVTRKRTYYLRADSAAEMESWLYCLREAQREVRRMVGEPQPIKAKGVSSTTQKPTSPTLITMPSTLSSTMSSAVMSSVGGSGYDSALVSPRASDGQQRVQFIIDGEAPAGPSSRAQSAGRARFMSGSTPIIKAAADELPQVL
jgi:hypothetical protein